MLDVQGEVQKERERQDSIWGGEDHDDEHELQDWFSFINTQLFKWGLRYFLPAGYSEESEARKRLIQIAALAVAGVESIDRKVLREEGGATSPEEG